MEPRIDPELEKVPGPTGTGAPLCRGPLVPTHCYDTSPCWALTRIHLRQEASLGTRSRRGAHGQPGALLPPRHPKGSTLARPLQPSWPPRDPPPLLLPQGQSQLLAWSPGPMGLNPFSRHTGLRVTRLGNIRGLTCAAGPHDHST